MAECPGHIGHLELAKPMFHIGSLNVVLVIAFVSIPQRFLRMRCSWRVYIGQNNYVPYDNTNSRIHIGSVPRRSINKRRGPKMKPVEVDQICAFDLLADVAEKLQEETESSTSSNACQAKDLLGVHLDEKKQEQVEDNNNKGSRSDCLDPGSCVTIPELVACELNLWATMAENDSIIHSFNNTTSNDSRNTN